MNVTNRLHQQLRAHVAGLTSPAAAVDLLIAHRTWLHRDDFLDRFIFTGTDFDTGERRRPAPASTGPGST